MHDIFHFFLQNALDCVDFFLGRFDDQLIVYLQKQTRLQFLVPQALPDVDHGQFNDVRRSALDGHIQRHSLTEHPFHPVGVLQLRNIPTASHKGGHIAVRLGLLHDAFLKIYGAFSKFEYRGAGSLRAWMERVTVNVALEWLRTRNRLGCVELDEGRAASLPDEPSAEEASRVPRDVLMRFVSELPDGYRAVFNLYCIEEYSHREIAQMLGINEKSSSSQLFRARTLLARRIRDYLKTH